MDKKLLFFDIDGTLLNGKHIVPDSTKVALKKLKEEGHLRFICTGRTKCMVPKEVLELGFDGYVFGAGTEVDYEGQILRLKELSEELLAKTIAVLREYGFLYLLEGSKNIYYEAESAEEERAHFSSYIKGFGALAKVIEKDAKIHASKITIIPPPGFTKEQLAAFKSKLEHDFNVIVHDVEGNDVLTDGLIELVPAGTNKATGIHDTITCLRRKKEETVGIGDSNNDLEMLAYTETSICMGNGTDKAKSLANFVAKHIDEDGIYDAMKTLGYIE